MKTFRKRKAATIARRLAHAALGLTAQAAPAFAQQAAGPAITVFAAGSLRDALQDVNAAFRKGTGVAVSMSLGPSGKLRGDIEGGSKADVFASADVAHTGSLAARKLLDGSATFAYNELCVVYRPALALTEANWLDVLKQPGTRLATSTPVSDPMGDYTWAMFRKADARQPGSYAILDRKALKLSGAGAPDPGRKLPYVTAFEEDRADAYVMYCTNAAATKKSLPDIGILRIPDAFNVRSAYGIGAAPGSRDGQRYVRFVLGPAGKAILQQYGFD